MPLRSHKSLLDRIYRRFNHQRYIHPDPLEFLFRYDDPADREVVGMVASALAYGRVRQILSSVEAVLKEMGSRPAGYVRGGGIRCFRRDFSGFRHRFSGGAELAAFLNGVGRLMSDFGGIEPAFMAGMGRGDGTVLPALRTFVDRLAKAAGAPCGHLLADPSRGGACKRLNLFLRWMVRRDAVDPGGWRAVSPALLLVPLDTHMHRLSLALGATARKSANMAAVEEVTAAFRKIAPQDPVKYDFALTRLGIRADLDMRAFLTRAGVAG